MKKAACLSLGVAGACWLVLAVCGPSFAQAPRAPLGGDGIWGSDTDVDFRVGFTCSQRAAACVNGPVNSGNVSHAENVQIGGNASHSGNPDNINGSNNAGNESHGTSSKSDNDLQIVGRDSDQRL